MAASVIPKVQRDGTITLTDGTNTYTVAYENGDLSFNNAKASRVVIRDRGTIVGVRKGEDPVPTVSFSVHMRDFTDSANLALTDVLDKAGAAASWTSTGGAGYEEYMLTASLLIEATDLGDTHDMSAVMSKVLFEWNFSEGSPNVINVTGEIFGGITYTGQA